MLSKNRRRASLMLMERYMNVATCYCKERYFRRLNLLHYTPWATDLVGHLPRETHHRSHDLSIKDHGVYRREKSWTLARQEQRARTSGVLSWRICITFAPSRHVR